MVREENSSRKPWVKLVKDQYLGHAFRDNEPVIRDDEDAWMLQLYDSNADSPEQSGYPE